MSKSDITIGNYTIELNSELNTGHFQLSPREWEILGRLIEGHSVKDTAEKLNLSPHTVDVFKRRVFKKLGVHNAASAAALGMAAFLGATITPLPHQKNEAPTDESNAAMAI